MNRVIKCEKAISKTLTIINVVIVFKFTYGLPNEKTEDTLSQENHQSP